MKILPIQTVSIHTPIMPPIMPTINIMNRIKVLEEVGKISEAMRLADEPAGDVKKNMKQMSTSKPVRLYKYWDNMSNIPEHP